MRRVVVAGLPLLVGLAACSSSTAGSPSAETSTVRGPVATSAEAPASPQPVAEGSCPYLDKAFVADANGQRVGKIKVSGDKPHPACFFYRPDGKVQLTAQVYVGEAGVAKALVDRAAPIATANRAELPAGWTGGAQSTDTGAVFAVAKGGAAIVITTNQKQTIKAKQVAEKAIADLGL